MLRSIMEILGYKIQAEDGEIGEVEDFYFDDEFWNVRYLVVATGSWMLERQVLIAPVALGEPDWSTQSMEVNLTRDQVKNSPDIDLAKPVSRQQEVDLVHYYGWPTYWSGPDTSAGPTPASVYPPVPEMAEERKEESREHDPHLRSFREVTGYRIQARDGEIGHVEDFIAGTEKWAIHYMIVDTGNWLTGRKVILSPQWIEAIDWTDMQVHIDLKRETIKNSPEYDPSAPVNREYEQRLYDYYGRPKYWEL